MRFSLPTGLQSTQEVPTKTRRSVTQRRGVSGGGDHRSSLKRVCSRALVTTPDAPSPRSVRASLPRGDTGRRRPGACPQSSLLHHTARSPLLVLAVLGNAESTKWFVLLQSAYVRFACLLVLSSALTSLSVPAVHRDAFWPQRSGTLLCSCAAAVVDMLSRYARSSIN